MKSLYSVYSQAGLNEEAKFGSLCIAVMKISDDATFAIYRGRKRYEELGKALKDFESTMKTFTAASKEDKAKKEDQVGSQSSKHVKLLAFPVTCV